MRLSGKSWPSTRNMKGITSMKIVRFMVTLTLPDHVTPTQARKDLLASIEFGRPSVICTSIAENLPDPQDVQGE